MRRRRRDHAVPSHFQAAQENEFPGLREPGIRNQREGSTPRHAALRSLYARGSGRTGLGLAAPMATIPIGAKGERKLLVTTDVAITFLGADGPRVLSTPHMIGFMEMTCRGTVLPFLESGHDTVGSHVNVAPLG